MKAGNVRYFQRALESQLGAHEALGWSEGARDYIPSIDEAVLILEREDEPQKQEADTRDRWDLLPWAELRDVVRTLTFGGKKPGRSDFGWQRRPRAEHVQAAMRHVTSYLTGERKDPETGLPTLAHAIARLLFVAWHDNNSKE